MLQQSARLLHHHGYNNHAIKHYNMRALLQIKAREASQDRQALIKCCWMVKHIVWSLLFLAFMQADKGQKLGFKGMARHLSDSTKQIRQLAHAKADGEPKPDASGTRQSWLMMATDMMHAALMPRHACIMHEAAWSCQWGTLWAQLLHLLASRCPARPGRPSPPAQTLSSTLLDLYPLSCRYPDSLRFSALADPGHSPQMPMHMAGTIDERHLFHQSVRFG